MAYRPKVLEVVNGGTGVATLTNHGILVGADTGNITQLATGSSGQVLRSGGASADPEYSTATYPSTSGSSGNVLMSDGTNFVSSSGSSLGNLLLATTTLTSAQIKALHGTPIQLVAAPGANKVIMPLSISAQFKYGGTNVFTAAAGQSVDLYYNNTSLQVFSGSFIPAAMITSSANKFTQFSTVSNYTNRAVGSIDNVNVALYNPIVTEVAGNAANNNTISVKMVYWIADVS